MTKNTSRVQPADALVQRARRRHFRVATLAAVFSLFALYVAWHEAHGPIARHDDELPITQAHADDAAQPDNAAATPTAAASSDLVKRGEYLARAGDCVACHTADKARPFAGGLPINTPFGTIVTPNITPDPDTGIGQWSDADFLRAMHEGVGKSGERLYPAFPYAEYTKVTDQDALAIRAYLNTLTPIHYAPPSNSLKFPFNQRWLMVFWNLFNFDEGRFVPDPKQSAEWNRGAYLVQGLAHCEECHTPRNFTQGLKTSSRLSGAVQAGWHAYNITSDKTSGVGNWSDDELAAYLSTGAAPGRANAAGPMAEVVTDSTQYLTREDIRSIVIYLRSVPPINGGESRPRDQWGNPAVDDVTALRGTKINAVNGAQLFIANCATCHNWTGQGVGASAPGAYPSLIHNSAVGASDANNLAMVILRGVSRTTKQADVLMPAFGTQLTDDQVAAITNYVTKQFGNPQSTVTVDQVAKLRTQQ
ncbi:Fructose dehydrogenase cytochrome subunit [Paraburkholderia nemoris]|uniref:cytochrome c n=1 Tax=Paraburkholderia nemoris TaxID=2793076 RepID=UPI00190CAE9A|nr:MULTISPECIES: cytochrome c [Paraburkholderia]MBK3779068.1 c-type cytochrome [Paraburkholderia aspalathi]CAE6703514.1 Fructose dehydrogenase cytochrome subunit [Paraburkholderia nemoris]